MGYEIRYDQELNKRFRFLKPIPKRKRLSVRILVMLALVIALLIPQIRYAVISYLIPGEPRVTIDATKQMIDDITRGQAVTEAFSTFCRTIINGG